MQEPPVELKDICNNKKKISRYSKGKKIKKLLIIVLKESQNCVFLNYHLSEFRELHSRGDRKNTKGRGNEEHCRT